MRKSGIDLKKVSFSIGAFRMNKDFLKKLRKIHLSEVVWYPFEIKNQEARYKDEEEILKFVSDLIFTYTSY
jgi:spore photoproduct lyase